ncbi:sorting nexin-11-like, partial [Hypanus sabinus]|uniref:sorting nexin-11-like n=1 Tax=Hypanus sabinus TaxID=79690 RepID=UPI0028C3E37F
SLCHTLSDKQQGIHGEDLPCAETLSGARLTDRPFVILFQTNSKAFTVKTSCVRRRYREFEWLRRRLQKNAGLVSLPELPGKRPFLQVGDAESIERRRQGLQQFLQRVLHTTVLLSDSQLHLFLQTQLSTAQIESCVQGRTSFSVNEAILSGAHCGNSLAEADGPIGYESESSPCHAAPTSLEGAPGAPAASGGT